MDIELLDQLHLLNPWLEDRSHPILDADQYITRIQMPHLLDPEWDSLWTLLIGPRRSGKTTLGKALAQELLTTGRYENLLYLNCDFLAIRRWLSTPLFISQAMKTLSLKHPILFIDEVQRLENPGLLLKAIVDLELPIKHLATGSSQLEIRSKVQEFLTGRQITSLVLPASHQEWNGLLTLEQRLQYGCYPQVIRSKRKETVLAEIYERYIQKDIIEILRVGNPDILRRLLTLVAHSSGQLVNVSQLATDCGVSTTMIRNHLDILEQTFVIDKVTPFVGNKRSEVTHAPIYYFIDNGFRNIALRNFTPLERRSDQGLLVEGFVFQEILKYKAQRFHHFDIHFWRTTSGAEVDFVIHKNAEQLIPVEVKYRRLTKPTVSRGYRSFIEAYQPRHAILMNRNLIDEIQIDSTTVHFIPLEHLERVFELIESEVGYNNL